MYLEIFNERNCTVTRLSRFGIFVVRINNGEIMTPGSLNSGETLLNNCWFDKATMPLWKWRYVIVKTELVTVH